MSISPPKVSVVMSVYNGSRYLQESVQSILNQTFTDFEFIIIDDGSSDNSWEILTKYASKDTRIKLHKNQENIGLTKSLNRGLNLAKGEYIARQDADDISILNRLQLQVDFLDAHPEIGGLGSAVEFIDCQGSVVRQLEVPTDHETLEALLLINNCLWHSSMTIRRSLLQKLGGYNEEMLCTQDYDLWWRISRKSRLATLPDILLQYRLDNASAVSKLKRKQQLECAQKISFRAIQESLPQKTTSLDKQAYERFWWAYLELIDRQSYQKCWYSDRGQQALVKWQDLELLEPFWNLLANHPAGTKIWGPRFYQLAIHFLRSQQTLVGLRLLGIGWRQLQMPIQWGTTIGALLKPYTPAVGQKLWGIWKSQFN